MRVAVALLAVGLALAAHAQVAVEREELAGAIAGRACRDTNRDGRCSADEPGYPGLRLVMETGQQVFTDSNGRYHLAAVSSRLPDQAFGGRLLPGRHRIRADRRGLLPGSRILPEAATVEVPMAGLVLQDFAVQESARSARAAPPAPAEVPRQGSVAAEGIEYTVAGKVAPGEQVEVDGAPASVDADGLYTARVVLRPGANEVPVRVMTDGGDVRLFVQRVDVVKRPSGILVVPRPLRSSARVTLPGTQADPAAAGAARVRVEAAPGTTLQLGEQKVTVDDSGGADVPVELATGANRLSLRIQRPGEAERVEALEVEARSRPFVVGLLDLEASWRLDASEPANAFALLGRGAAHAEVPFGRWLVEGELELRDGDLAAFREDGVSVLAAPRSPFNLERALDPERHATHWADQSTSIVPNSTEARVRLEARHPKFGRAGFGTFRAQFSDSEVGRFHRELFGAYAVAQTAKDASLQGRLEAFASPQAVDPASGITTLPAHAEFLATGGSLFYLPHAFVARGSEQVRVVLRDGLTAVPVADRHLIRGVDYELDATSGRILLAEPLSFAVAPPFFGADAPTAGAEPVLVVDYEYLDANDPSRPVVGGRASGSFGPAKLSVGAVREAWNDEAYSLVRGTASTRLGRLVLSADAAISQGQAHAAPDVTLSSSGGLDFVTDNAARGDDGWAFTARLRGPTFHDGHLDAAYRRREGDFSDASWDGRGRLAEVYLAVEQPLGPVVLGALGDSHRGVDPRDPFGDREVASQLLGGFLAYRTPSFEARLEAKDQALTLNADAPEASQLDGGRTSAGALARYRVLDNLWLQAAHKQVLSQRGDGPGAYDDSFSSVGADVAFDERSVVGVRGGWGPELGALAWVQAQVGTGPDVFYGSYSVDVDGPDFGERRAVSGARTLASDGTAVFVEDVGAHDATSVRLARAVGVSSTLAPGWDVSARYERGVRMPFATEPALRRDAGAVSLRYLREKFRAYARGELRYERGEAVLVPFESVDRRQRIASGAVTYDLLSNLQLGGRINFSDTYNRELREARLLEANANLAWRLEPLMVVVHYGIERELSPVRMEAGERSLERVSVMPSLKLGDRFAIAAGLHAGWSTANGNDALVLSASVRPSVRVVGGLELAAEVARRSQAPDDGELTALRGEVGYRFDDALLVAGGYSLFGYQGLGLTPDQKQVPRVYMRAEAAW